MSRLIKATSFIAVLWVSVAAVIPGPAEAASPSKADKATLKRAIVACKAEAKGKKGGSLAANTSTIASRKL